MDVCDDCYVGRDPLEMVIEVMVLHTYTVLEDQTHVCLTFDTISCTGRASTVHLIIVTARISADFLISLRVQGRSAAFSTTTSMVFLC